MRNQVKSTLSYAEEEECLVLGRGRGRARGNSFPLKKSGGRERNRYTKGKKGKVGFNISLSFKISAPLKTDKVEEGHTGSIIESS